VIPGETVRDQLALGVDVFEDLLGRTALQGREDHQLEILPHFLEEREKIGP
jgi:hypothetical protein